MSHRYVSVQAVCFELTAKSDTDSGDSNESVLTYKTMFKLARGVNEPESIVKWEDEGTLTLQLRKEDAPSYWPVLIETAMGDNELKVGSWN